MKMLTKRVLIPALIFGSIAVSTSGCFWRPYDKPEFVTIEANQTAFVVPLEGATSDQGQFESVDFLKKAQVATKRIQIPHKWVQTGRAVGSGEWMDTVRVIVVDRAPETREWKDDLSFTGESRDSIKFKQGMSATVQVLEEDTAVFLYQYSGKTLKDVTDSEVRNKIGSVLLEKYSTMSINDLRADKASIIEFVRSEVEPYFKHRGITLSNIGYIADVQYLQADIQEAINKKFKEEQEKDAQTVSNQRALEKAQNEVDVARQEAMAAKERQATMSTQIELMRVQNEAAWIEALASGKVTLPSTLVQGSGSNMIQIPAVGK
jgi:hypothetical protein